MASAGYPFETDDKPKHRSNSPSFIRPDFSALRVVLLGNSFSRRREVGNLILKEERITEKEPAQCEKFISEFGDKTVTIINTPDLLEDSLSVDQLNNHVETLVKLSDPGPHVFLLVLQPDNFTEKQKLRLCRILKRLGDHSFDHSMVLISSPREKREDESSDRLLKEMIVECQYRHLQLNNLELPELLTRVSQTVKENNGCFSCDVFQDAAQKPMEDFKKEEVDVMFNPKTDYADGFRIVMFGKSEEKKKSLCKMILNKKQIKFFKHNPSKHSEMACGDWNGKPLKVVKCSDIFSLRVDALIEEMQCCLTLCLPGPNVLMLLVRPSDFTEKDRKTLKFVLGLFPQDAFRHAMVVLTHENDMSRPGKELLRECNGRYFTMFREDRKVLMQEIQNIVDINGEAYLTFREDSSRSYSEQMKPPLNLVLCGNKGAGKTSAAKAILGHLELHSASTLLECVRNQGVVLGRKISLVELPALNGKAQYKVMEESFKCVSLCDPEGVHAFILVLPVGPLTDEDKEELQTIQDTFSSRVNDFTMILFTTGSDPTHEAFVNFLEGDRDIQELCQRFGERYLGFDTKNRQQIPKLLESIERTIMQKDIPGVYTSETFVRGQIEKNMQQDQSIAKLKAEIKELKQTQMDLGAESEQSFKHLRIVLIGKTGCGKSSSGNTILGFTAFKAESSPKSVTKLCQIEEHVVDGRHVAVVDTPGLFDNSLTNKEVNDETLKCMSLLAPGPHVFLLVIKIGRFTPEEKETVRLIKEGFGKGAEMFTIILFTNGDELANEHKTIEEYMEKDEDAFEKLISDCGGRYHVFINRKTEQDRSQVSELMRKIDMMMKENGGGFYTNKMLQEAEAAIQKKTETILKEKEEEMKREREELQRKYDEAMKEMKKKMEEKEKLKQEAERKLKEIKEYIDREKKQREIEQKERERMKTERELNEEKSKQSLMEQIEELDKQIKSEKEENKCVTIELERIKNEKERTKEDLEKKYREWQEKQKEEEEKRKQEEQRKLKELEEQYKKEQERYEERQREEQTRREEEEKQRKILEEKLENLQKENEKKAREEAVKSNEFQEKYKKKFEAQKEAHENQMKDKDEKYDLLKALAAHMEAEKRKQYQTEIRQLVNCVSKKRKNLTAFKELLIRQEQELKKKETQAEKEELQENHETEITELVEKLLNETSTPFCCIL